MAQGHGGGSVAIRSDAVATNGSGDYRSIPVYAAMAAQWGCSSYRAAAFPIFEYGVPAVYRHMLEEQVMSMNKDQVKGRTKEAEGKIKEVAGKLVGNEKLEEKGKIQKVLGKAQAKFGDVKKDVKDSTKGV
jgi:uncharacterized protein YjbJ (UPF0337 family)